MSALKKSLRKSIKLYIIWSLIYLPINIYGEIFEWGHDSILDLVASWVRNFLFTGDNYYSWILWYLNAYIVAIVLIYTLMKLFGLNICKISLISLILYFVGWSYTEYHDIYSLTVYDFIFQTTRNGFFRGFCLVSIGLIVAQYRFRNNLLLLMMILIGAIINHSLLIPLMTWCLLSLLLNLKIEGNPRIFIVMRKMSSYIYFTHLLVVFFCLMLNMERGTEMFLVVAVITSLLSAFLVYLDTHHYLF